MSKSHFRASNAEAVIFIAVYILSKITFKVSILWFKFWIIPKS